MNPQFFKLYQGDHENTAWWDLRHCVIFSGGIFFSWLCLNGRSQPSSCQCTSVFLTCAKGCVAATHLVWLLGSTEFSLFSGWPARGRRCAVRGAVRSGRWVTDLPAKGLGAGSCCWTCPLHLLAALRPSDTIEL